MKFLIFGLYLIFTIKIVIPQKSEFCPESCDLISCTTSQTQDDCSPKDPKEIFAPREGLCGCCPGCKSGLGKYKNKTKIY